MLLKGKFRVVVGGNDVTSRFDPTLLSVSVTRSARDATDRAQLSLADPDGRTLLPETGAPIEVYLGQEASGLGLVFEGFVDSVRWSMNKRSGRTISVDGSSADRKSKVKAPGLRSAAEKSFGDVAKDWGSKAGLTVTVAGDLGAVFRPYWLMQHESFIGWGQRMAKEMGASFKVIGRRGFFAPLNEGISATGKTLTPIRGEWGVNLKEVDVAPLVGRPVYGKAISRHYDISKAKWVEIEKAIDSAGIDVDFRSLMGAATRETAEQGAGANAKESEREKGDGTATILGDHRAEPEAKFILSGARPGVDGTYLIDALTHNLSKGDGFTTSLTLKHPADGAGKDARA